jgi:hypothetical protein
MTMTDRNDRQAAFVPPPRPDWVQRVNAEGQAMDIRAIVPLDEQSLLDWARANTGLDDFGDEAVWREPLRVLLKALDEEAELTLIGRLMTRADLLIYLEGRLRVEEAYRLHPEIADQAIVAPLFITGQGRTGTSELLNLLATDPDNAVMLNWQAMFPAPPPESADVRTDPRIARATEIIEQTYRVTPEMRAIHLYGGDVPCENVHFHCLSFRTGGYINAHFGQVPSYLAYMATQDPAIAYAYEKRVLKVLQWKNPRARWVFKSPYAMVELPAVLKVYPDARIVVTTRDPIKALSSITNHIGTLTWVRSDKSFIGGSDSNFLDAAGVARTLTRVVDWLEDGTIPPDQVMAVAFKAFIADPVAMAEAIYTHFGLTMTPQARAAMQAYVAADRRGQRPAHSYDTGDAETISRERPLFRRFQDYFNVPSEV